MHKSLTTVSAISLALALSACGGGGSNGGVNSPGTTPPPVTPAPTPTPTPAPTPAPTPTPTPAPSPTASEDALSRAAAGMQAKAAYDAGLTGKGVTIAIMDSGINASDPEFAGRISADSTSFDQKVARCGTCAPETVRFDLKDNIGHGTETAGIALAARDTKGMHGVAPEATLMVLKITGPDLTNVTPTSGPIPEGINPNPALMAPAITHAVEKGAFVISMSINGTASGQIALDQRAAMDMVRNQNRLFVQSVSNVKGEDSFAGTIAENLVGADFANKDWFLFGIRVDKNLSAPTDNGIPGALADRTLAVVALDVVTTGKDGQLVTVNGNSFAAPAIAGAAALLKQYWPQLGGKEISRILLDTATDLGAPGVDQVYGAGLLNVAKAMQAQTPKASFSSVSAAQTAVTSLSFSGAFGSDEGAATWSSFAGQALAVDKYGRDYAFNIGLQSASRAANGVSVYSQIALPMQRAEAPTTLARMAAQVSPTYNTSAHPIRSNAPAAFAFRTSPNTVVRGSFNTSVENNGLASGSMFRTLGLATTGSAAQIEHKGFVYGFSSASTSDRGNGSATQTVRFQTPEGFSVSFANSRETGSALGLRGEGEFRINGAKSTFLGLGWQGRALGFGLSAEAMMGRTKVNASSGRLAFDAISTSGFRFIADHSAFGGQATFGLTSPLRVDSAQVRYTAPTGFDIETMSVVDQTRTLNLAPSGREMDVELGWGRSFGASSLSLGAVYGLNAGNRQGASSAGGWVRFNTAF